MKEDYEFEWDEAKDATNRKKHGTSFEEAEAIWDDPAFTEEHVMDIPEDRWVVIGRIGKGAYLTAVITYRGSACASYRRASRRRRRLMSMAKISTEEFERLFDEGADITPYLDKSSKRRPNQERAAKRISMDVPEEMVRRLDRAATRMGVNRQAVIKVWLTERLDQEDEKARERAAV